METTHPSNSVRETHNPWQHVMESLLGMVRVLETTHNRPVSLLKFAEGFTELARAYLVAITHEGRTSIRAEAVVKALDLHTKKSVLLRFLERSDMPE